MTSNPIDWTKDVATDPKLEYRALLKSLRRTRDFGLFFVQCSPAEGQRLIGQVKEDLPQKHIEVLKLEQAIDNLYDIVDALPNKDQIEILFIQGLELSLYEYEQDKLWSSSEERYGYSEGNVPKLLAHLNLSRERFRDHFQLCLVFLVPLFALKYLMRRAPDFFDWRSGVLEFIGDPDQVQQDSRKVWLEGNYQQYLSWTPQQRNARILEIQALLEEPFQTNQEKAALLLEQGNLFHAAQNYKAAIASYDNALQIKPDKHEAWNNRGIALDDLGRKEEAIASYDNALQIKPDKHEAWYNRGNALSALGRKEEAIASCDYALEIKPDDALAWYNKACCYALWGKVDEAIETLQRAIELDSELREYAKTDSDFERIRDDNRFQALMREAV